MNAILHPADKLLEAIFSCIEDDVIPKTKEGVAEGCKVFGAAILKKDDLALVRSPVYIECLTYSQI